MANYIYDIECFPNLFAVTFVNADSEGGKQVYYTGFGNDERATLKKFLNTEPTLVGYNSVNYDDAMLRFAMQYQGDDLSFLKDIHNLSCSLVSDAFDNDKNIRELRYPRKKSSWKTIDLMKILAFDKMGISLKQTSINLKWHKIQDLPLPPDTDVSKNDLGLILDYNLNDVLITKKLYETIAPIRRMRDELGKIYHIDFSSASDSKIANLILEHTYSKELNMDVREIRDMRTQRESVLLAECIAPFVKFFTQTLKDMLDRISTRVVYSYEKYVYSEKIYFANCKFALGIGGLHSDDAPGVFITDEDYIIQDMDVASYYPNLIINNNFYPEHLGESFIKVLKSITDARLDAKRAGRKVEADGLKITANSIFGKMGFEYFWLYDPKQMLSTTLTGQLGLLMLIEGLHQNGIEIISSNTDGIVCKIPIALEARYYEISHAWEKLTNLQLEFTPYKKYVRRDVNSYITQKESGEIKAKGAFLEEVDLKKAYHMPIVAKAMNAYFINGVPVEQTVKTCTDIMEFCISQKSGKNYGIEYHTTKGIEKLQKTNRFYVTTDGGVLIKREKTSGKLIGVMAGSYVRVLNDFDPGVPFGDYKVNHSFYIQEVMKIVHKIEPQQLSLFG